MSTTLAEGGLIEGRFTPDVSTLAVGVGPRDTDREAIPIASLLIGGNVLFISSVLVCFELLR